MINQNINNPDEKNKKRSKRQETEKRRKRFERDSEEKEYTLQAPDFQILELVHDYRFINTAHLEALTGKHRLAVQRRLQNLFHYGYVDRPSRQMRSWNIGSNKMVYAISNKGARVLRKRGHPIPKGIDWYEKNKEAQAEYMDHRMGISDFRAMLSLAVSQHPGNPALDPVCHSDSPWWEWQGGPKDQSKRPKITYKHDGREFKASIHPDGHCSIGFGNDESPLFIEYDSGSMPVYRANPNLTSIYRKFVVYSNLWKQELEYRDGFRESSPLQDYFGVKHFRVLFITNSEKRIKNMIHLLEEDPFLQQYKSKKIFWFITKDQVTLDEPINLFKPIWYWGDTNLEILWKEIKKKDERTGKKEPVKTKEIKINDSPVHLIPELALT